jgi:multiple sugar transport system permease protein
MNGPNISGPGRRLLGWTALTLTAAAYATPLIYFVLGSFRQDKDVLSGMRGFLPVGLSMDNYRKLITETLNGDSMGYLWRFFLNSFVITGVVVIGGMLVNSMAAYAFARLRWRGRDALFAVVAALFILPFEAIAVPLYYMLHSSDHLILVQCLPFVANSFSIYLFYSFFISLPKQIDEAARIDGAGPWRVFLLIIVPMSKPVFASVAILTFLQTWGQ